MPVTPSSSQALRPETTADSATTKRFMLRPPTKNSPSPADEKRAEYVAALEAMYETDAWETVRSRNGWVNIWNPGDDFRTFLEAQETEIGDLMRTLGFL